MTATFSNAAFLTQEKVINILALKDMNMMKLPNALTEIEEEAFYGTTALAVIIPDECTTIGKRAFANCPNLIYVYIPASVKNIADDAFDEGVILDYGK